MGYCQRCSAYYYEPWTLEQKTSVAVAAVWLAVFVYACIRGLQGWPVMYVLWWPLGIFSAWRAGRAVARALDRRPETQLKRRIARAERERRLLELRVTAEHQEQQLAREYERYVGEVL